MKLKLYAAIVLLITISCNTKSKNKLDTEVKTSANSSHITSINLFEDYIGKKGGRRFVIGLGV